MGKPVTISDLRARAGRRLPGFAYAFLEGGAGAENGLRRNEEALDRVTLLPRYLVNIEERSTAVTLFGRAWRAPIGAAPIGMANLIWPGADLAIARACRAAGLPGSISTAASTSLEDFREVAGDCGWFMLYPGRAEAVVADLVDRAEAAGYDTLIVTVDIPLASIRPREQRAGMAAPLRFTPRLIADAMLHPRWTLATLRAGTPQFANMARYAGPASGANAQAAYLGRQTTGRFDWERLADLRARWPHRMVVKGILAPADAERARALGCDGIIVSNHGGRQMDGLPGAIEVLPGVRAAVGPDFPVLFDSGVRSGEHVVKALALGADFVLCGRALLYGLAALGPGGAAVALEMLRTETDVALGQLGYRSIAELKAAAPVFRGP